MVVEEGRALYEEEEEEEGGGGEQGEPFPSTCLVIAPFFFRDRPSGD